MSTERSPSVEQLARLRARLVRFQLHAEAAGLWPGAVPSYRHIYPEAARAAVELLRVCRDAGAIRRAIAKVPRPASGGWALEVPGGWSPFWFAGISRDRVGDALTRLIESGRLVESGPFQKPTGNGATATVSNGYAPPKNVDWWTE